MSTPLRPRTTTAFFTQSMISFAVSLGITITGIGYLHDSRWIRGFLALGLLYVVTWVWLFSSEVMRLVRGRAGSG